MRSKEEMDALIINSYKDQIEYLNSELVRVRDLLATDSVERMEEALKLHYKEPVRPVSQYCQAFRDWAKAIQQKVKEIEAIEEPGPADHYDLEQWKPLGDLAWRLELSIYKSNLLYRLIYAGDELRTKKCPKHDGRWSGCVGFNEVDCGCVYHGNITGWLPNG